MEVINPHSDPEKDWFHRHKLFLATLVIVICGAGLLFQWKLNYFRARVNTDFPAHNAAATIVPSDWKTYANTEYGFEFKYLGKIVKTSSDYTRIQNYGATGLPEKASESGLNGSEFYLEINTFDSSNCEGLENATDKTVNGNKVAIGFGPYGGDVGGERKTLCINGNQGKDIFISITTTPDNTNFADQILSTFEFTGVDSVSGDSFVPPYKVGDTVKGMKVVSVDKYFPDKPSSAGNFVIIFKGEATISGNYYRKENVPGCGLVFFADAASKDKLPPNQAAGLCFNNQGLDAWEIFTQSEGTATILIDDYEISACDCDGGRKGMTLLKVINQS
jgi:hypothetical protein